jgi:hypothetical protein
MEYACTHFLNASFAISHTSQAWFSSIGNTSPLEARRIKDNTHSSGVDIGIPSGNVVWIKSPEDGGSIFLRKMVSTYKSRRRYNPEDHHRRETLCQYIMYCML